MGIFRYFIATSVQLVLLILFALPLYCQKAEVLKRYDSSVSCVRYNADGSYFAISEGDNLTLWNSKDPSEVASYELGKDEGGISALVKKKIVSSKAVRGLSLHVADISWSKSNSVMALRENGVVSTYTIEGVETFFTESKRPIRSITFYDGDDFFYSHGDRQVRTKDGRVPTGLDLTRSVVSLKSNLGGLLLVMLDNGKTTVFNTQTMQVVTTLTGDAAKSALLCFSFGGGYFVLPTSPNSFSIYRSSDLSVVSNFTAPNECTSVAITSDGSLLAVGTNRGEVLIVDIPTSTTLKNVKITRGDVAVSMDYSNSGKSLLIGGMRNYLYRYGSEDDTDDKTADNDDGDSMTGGVVPPSLLGVDGSTAGGAGTSNSVTDSARGAAGDGDDPNAMGNDDDATGKNGKKSKKARSPKGPPPKTKPDNSVTISIGYASIKEDYYIGAFNLQAGWRHYFNSIIYTGTNIGLGMGIPGNNFPYLYEEDGEALSPPFQYEFFLGGLFGAGYYNGWLDLMVFGEIQNGFNGRVLHNNSVKHNHTGSFFGALYLEISAGIQYKILRVWGSFMYDSNIKLRGAANIGFVIPVSLKKRGAAAKKADAAQSATDAALPKDGASPDGAGVPESDASTKAASVAPSGGSPSTRDSSSSPKSGSPSKSPPP